jgi:DNA-binding NarL/FixJ family response regulator
VADDHKIVREGLRMFLSLDPELEIIGEAANGVEAVNLSRACRPDVVLMDLLMPEMDGISAITLIRKEMPEVEVVALTSVLDNRSVLGAIEAGAIGYLLKDANPTELCKAIHAAVAGQVQLSPKAAEILVTQLQMPKSDKSLTHREKEVIRLVSEGKSNKEIALILNITQTTAKTHVSKILAKLNLASRTQAALYARQFGFG